MSIREYINEIQWLMDWLLSKTDKKEGSCLYMSALLFAQIHDNLPLRPRFVTGSLILNNRLVFLHEPILPVLTNGRDFSGSWGGHAWIEVEGYILDPSIFWAVYSSLTPCDLQNEFEKTFNGRSHYLIGSRKKLEGNGVIYKVYEEVTNEYVGVLIKSGFTAGFFDKSIG